MSNTSTSRTGAIELKPGNTDIATWRQIFESELPVNLEGGALDKAAACLEALHTLIDTGRPIYAVNTGFGKLASIRIDEDRLVELQRFLILSHAAGTGELLSDNIVRLILCMKAAALAQGFSGVRPELIEALLKLVNAKVYPAIPAKGSVGASGDLAPLSHMAVALLGLGDVRHDGRLMPATEGLKIAGLQPMQLAPKEGVALINGTQVSTALGLAGLFAAEDLFLSALVTGSLSVEACRGNDAPFDHRIHAVRRHQAQIDVAATYRHLLADSPLREHHRAELKVQDPYCLRCQPQVMGACLQNLRHAASVLETEANAVSDNPLVFPEDGDVLSGGNFHAEPVAFAADIIALAICEIGSLCERRQAMLVDSALSRLPAFLTAQSGINSGFMIAQVTSAALTSENKMLGHPASVDSIPTSANQEDHVSMACHAGYRLRQMNDNLAVIIALEWLAASQGLEFLLPQRPAAPLVEAVSRLRTRVEALTEDRFMAPDIEEARKLVWENSLATLVKEPLFASRPLEGTAP